jgi:hypothetical protein
MNSNRRTAILVGVLFLVSYLGVIAGSSLLEPALKGPDTLVDFQQRTQVMIGLLLELVNGIAVVAMAVILYPLLKYFNEGLALGYVAMRILECAVQISMDLGPLTLLKLSQGSVGAGASEVLPVQTTTALVLAERQSASLMLAIFFCAGAVLFYVLLYQSKLLPRFVSIWGLIAVALVFATNIMDIGMPLGMIFALPIISNELFVAIWLIVKGFNPSIIAPRTSIDSAATVSGSV